MHLVLTLSRAEHFLLDCIDCAELLDCAHLRVPTWKVLHKHLPGEGLVKFTFTFLHLLGCKKIYPDILKIKNHYVYKVAMISLKNSLPWHIYVLCKGLKSFMKVTFAVCDQRKKFIWMNEWMTSRSDECLYLFKHVWQ